MHSIPTIVLTGGPCAGKSSAIARVSDWCGSRGFRTFLVPEVATELIQSGFDPMMPFFQETILREILHKEDLRHKEALRYTEKTVIICDRGCMDGLAYNKDAFRDACRSLELPLTDLRDKRYAGVIFLRSAALGAEQFYTSLNNKARRESLDEARDLDERTLESWAGAPHVQVIENLPNQSFEEKMQETLRALARILGVPLPLECERKFVLHAFERARLPPHAVDIDIVQTYLITSEGMSERVRARGQSNHWVFFHTIKEPMGIGTSVERERIITRHEYESFLVRRDPQSKPIHKTRSCFFDEGRYIEVDRFHGHLAGLVLSEIEVHDMEVPVTLPEFLGQYTEVTNDDRYKNEMLALR